MYRSYLLRMRMFQTNVVQKIKTHVLRSVTFFFRKTCRLWDDVEKCSSVGQATTTIGRMRFEFWMIRAIKTHSEYVILFVFPLQQ
jgi:hypothetical protein